MNDEEFEKYRQSTARTLRMLLGVVVTFMAVAMIVGIYTN